MLRKELKFALPTSLGALIGLTSGAFLLYLIVGTAFGLVWGYGDHMLNGGKPHKHARHTKSTRRRSKSKKRKSSKKRRK
jgi:hypothetical protein